MLGLNRDNGKENENYYIIIGYINIYVTALQEVPMCCGPQPLPATDTWSFGLG